MPITPWYVGQLAPAWTISLAPDSGVLNVTGLVPGNFALTIRNIGTGTGAGTETAGLGTFSGITAGSTRTTSDGTVFVLWHASVNYQPVAADVAAAGSYRLFVSVTLGNGMEVFDLGTWNVVSL